MRLRVSGDDTGQQYVLDGVVDGGAVTGIGCNAELDALLTAICDFDAGSITLAREALCATAGWAALADAVAVIAAFNAYPRMADATGIPLEAGKVMATASLRAELRLERMRIDD